MEALLQSVAQRIRPELKVTSGLERAASVADVTGFLYSAPLALLGLAWLAVVTDPTLLAQEWTMLSILFILAILFDRLRFFIYMVVRGLSISAEGSLCSVVIWSGALLFGPSALWLAVLGSLVDLFWGWRVVSSSEARWGRLRSFSLRLAGTIAPGLLSLALYERWGGSYPLAGLAVEDMLPALYAIAIQFALSVLIHAPFILYIGSQAAAWTDNPASLWSFVRAGSVGLVLPALAAPFAILAAGLHTHSGAAVFLLFVGGLLAGSFMARQLSQAVERSQQRSRELEQLVQLGHALSNAPPDASTLPELLKEHVPGMFPFCWIEIRRLPNDILVRVPDSDNGPGVPEAVWNWIHTSSQARSFAPNAVAPWDQQPIRQPLVVAPVIDSETTQAVGGIYIAPRRDVTGVASLLPAVESLAAQISATLHSAQVYARALEHQKVEQELALAGEIQASFLPDTLPEVPGWQLAVTLEPARQTSGDFYDVIPLPNGRVGVLVADVADKGIGAALYMALSRTLIRTYAVEHHTRPDFALRVANNRILTDAHVDLFVTVFYGVLDPLSGRLTYCNAGHNPPLLLRAQNATTAEWLTRTGIPLGISKGQTWEQRSVQLGVGDMLILYTDGVTEAQNDAMVFFGEQRLLSAAQAQLGSPAQEVQDGLLGDIHGFVGAAPQFDDIALMVLLREG